MSGGHLGCGFGTEAPWAAGAEGRGGEVRNGGGEVGGGAGTLARGPARGKPKKSDQGRAAGTRHREVRGAREGRQGAY